LGAPLDGLPLAGADGPLMVPPLEVPLELEPLVAAIEVPDSAQVSAANASA
jgi:hypothetical protein